MAKQAFSLAVKGFLKGFGYSILTSYRELYLYWAVLVLSVVPTPWLKLTLKN